MNISEAEKIKNPVLAFIGGVFFAFPIAWTVITYNHAEEIRIYESAKAEESKKSHDLEKKYLEQKNELQVKKDELLSLRKELEAASGKIREDKTTRLQALIEQINKQIAYKNIELARQSNPRVLSVEGFGVRDDQSKSDAYLRTEKEIDSLLSRRDQAQKQMIEVNAQ